MGRDRSRPRVNGTMQNEHMLLQPRITLINARWSPFCFRTGIMSLYVSSRLNCVLILKLLSSKNLSI